MISTFLKTLGPTYQLMLLTASTRNFAEVINKATNVQLAIRTNLVTEATIVPSNTSPTVPKKGIVTCLESNAI